MINRPHNYENEKESHCIPKHELQRDDTKHKNNKRNKGGSETVPGYEARAILVPLLEPTRTRDQITHDRK